MTGNDEVFFFIFAGFIGGLVNVIAGGAKLFVFPMLLASGLPPLVANATATVGLWPAQLPGAWVFKNTLASDRKEHTLDALVTATGAVIGVVLLYTLGEAVFLALVPAFLAIAIVAILFGDHLPKLGQRLAVNRAAARALFLLIGIYAGYFGAGYGFLIMAAVFLVGESSVHIAGARKNFISFGANTAAVIPLSMTGLVAWEAAVAILFGGLVGGGFGGKLMKVLSQKKLKIVIAGCGFALVARYILFL
tara:strand:+ start:1188 stop:1934 length:747 start_codon:yes stop_codon:yes gene_type:complete